MTPRVFVVGTIFSPPFLDQRLPLCVLFSEPLTWMQVFNSLCELPFSDPSLEVLPAFGLAFPHKLHLLKTLLFRWYAEVRKVVAQILGREVRHDRLPEPQRLLLICQSLRRRTRILCFVCLCLQHHGLHLFFVLLRWLSHDNHGDFFEALVSLQSFLAFCSNEIVTYLHNNKIPLQAGGERLDHSPATEVVHVSDVEVHSRPVITDPGLRLITSGPSKVTNPCPFQNSSVTNFHIARVVLEEGVKPIKCTLIRQSHGEDDFLLSIRLLQDVYIIFGSLHYGQTPEGQG
mmetsp:Transcript_51713/g.121039  ORF Transcript_51713/g.121039 Transcript_51713/m.121039 type:complete len:288 (+) Transcript_51713:1177-2040(+)